MYKYPATTDNKYTYVGNPTCITSEQLVRSGYELYNNPNGIVEVRSIKSINTEASILKNTNYFINTKSCCERLGYKFDIETQKCYWSNIPETKVDICNDCTTKVVYNTKGNDGTLFNVNNGETCDLTVSLDYILNFDCSLFTKTCNENSELISEYESTINTLQTTIISKKSECEVITNQLNNANNLFNELCYVIKGTKTINNRFNNDDEYNQIIYPEFNNFNNDFSTTPLEPINNNNTIDNIIPLGELYNPINFKAPTIGDTWSSLFDVNNNPPPFAFSWAPESWQMDNIWDPHLSWYEITPIPTILPANYCLTTRGLELWQSILSGRYSSYIDSYGCDETSYTQNDFDNFYNSVLAEIGNDYLLSITDFMVETTQQPCDKSIAFTEYSRLLRLSNDCTKTLIDLNNQLITTTNNLNDIKTNGPTREAISNLEKLQVFLNLEVEETNNVYKSIYEEQIFNIGTGNLLNYILNESPNTGILISGATSNGILQPPFTFIFEDYNYSPNLDCNTGRDAFIKELYLSQYKNNYPDPTTPDEQLALNKKMNAWYNSSWLYYNKKIDSSITSQILNKKIKISLRIENCCLDLCILTDNLTLTKSCESLDNQEIIISKSHEFEIERVMDNRKSWVSYTETTTREHDLQFRETQYDVDDYRLTINTKEIDLKIDGANAIEEDVLCNIDCLISGTTNISITGCSTVNLDTFLTTELSNINNVDEFRKAINAELIDVKTRQTLSSYPTIRLLYERYLGYCTECEKSGNKFTYLSMDTFIDLIGKNWVDLAEQFVPATTIWGATDVYRNSIFHQQKHKYRRSNLEFNRRGFGMIKNLNNTTESIIYDVTLQPMPEILPTSATTIDFQAAAQTAETPRSNPDTPIKLNFQVGTTTQTFGNLTTSQVNAIQSQSNTITQQSISGNVFLIKKTVNYGLSSGPSHSSPIFYGKTIIHMGHDTGISESIS